MNIEQVSGKWNGNTQPKRYRTDFFSLLSLFKLLLSGFIGRIDILKYVLSPDVNWQVIRLIGISELNLRRYCSYAELSQSTTQGQHGLFQMNLLENQWVCKLFYPLPFKNTKTSSVLSDYVLHLCIVWSEEGMCLPTGLYPLEQHIYSMI